MNTHYLLFSLVIGLAAGTPVFADDVADLSQFVQKEKDKTIKRIIEQYRAQARDSGGMDPTTAVDAIKGFRDSIQRETGARRYQSRSTAGHQWLLDYAQKREEELKKDEQRLKEIQAEVLKVAQTQPLDVAKLTSLSEEVAGVEDSIQKSKDYIENKKKSYRQATGKFSDDAERAIAASEEAQESFRTMAAELRAMGLDVEIDGEVATIEALKDKKKGSAEISLALRDSSMQAERAYKNLIDQKKKNGKMAQFWFDKFDSLGDKAVSLETQALMNAQEIRTTRLFKAMKDALAEDVLNEAIEQKIRERRAARPEVGRTCEAVAACMIDSATSVFGTVTGTPAATELSETESETSRKVIERSLGSGSKPAPEAGRRVVRSL